jgi:hypothetical protein
MESTDSYNVNIVQKMFDKNTVFLIKINNEIRLFSNFNY